MLEAEPTRDGVVIRWEGVTVRFAFATMMESPAHRMEQMLKLLRYYMGIIAGERRLRLPLKGRYVETETEFVFEGETEFTVPRRIVIPGEAYRQEN
jgi:hypothetical protein